MEDTPQQEKSKSDISITVWVLALVVCLIFDALSLIPLVGDIEDVPMGVMLVINIVLGVVGPAINIIQGIVMVLKLFPVVQEFPLWTAGWLVAVIIELISKAIPAVKPAVQAVEKIAEIKSGNAGELGEAGAEAAAAGAQQASGVAAQAGGGAAAGAKVGVGAGVEGEAAPSGGAAPTGGGAQEIPQTPPEEEAPLEEVGGAAMENLKKGLLEPPPEEEAPPASLPYRGENVIESPDQNKKAA